MRNGKVPVKCCVLLLIAALVWYMVGAPVDKDGMDNLKQAFWQARILLPQRMQRVLLLWQANAYAEKDTFDVVDENEDTKTVSVYLADEKRLVIMPVENYVCGVVAAEMPAQYHLEALKAQAVAARTRVISQQRKGGCERCEGADICTDSTHCQGYISPAQCRHKWLENGDMYEQRVKQAVIQTREQWIAYNGEPIQVLYHAMSGGKTEDSQAVFSSQLPYLVSVDSSEEMSNGYYTDTFFTYEELAAKMCGDNELSNISADEIQKTFAIEGYTASGRVKSVQAAGITFDATEFRTLLGLRSTWFSISMDDEGITFHQQGYGHGVGMSQAGANYLASNGADYETILKHYFTGVEIVKP